MRVVYSEKLTGWEAKSEPKFLHGEETSSMFQFLHLPTGVWGMQA